MEIGKEEIIHHLLQKTQEIEDPQLMDYFSDYQEEEKKILFSSLYDGIFGKKIKGLHEHILHGVITVLLTTKEDPVNSWIIEEMKTKKRLLELLQENLFHLQKPLQENGLQLDFGDETLHLPFLKTLFGSDFSLSELLTSEKGLQELAKKQMLSALEGKISKEGFHLVQNIIQHLEVFSYDLKSKKISVNMENSQARYLFPLLQGHLHPLKIIGGTTPEAEHYRTLTNTFISSQLQDFLQFTNSRRQHPLEILDIRLQEAKVILKWNIPLTEKEKEEVAPFFRKLEQSLLEKPFPDANEAEKPMHIEIFEEKADFLSFFQLRFKSFFQEAKISGYESFRVADFSFVHNTLFVETSMESYHTLEHYFEKNEIGKVFQKRFPKVTLIYHIMKQPEHHSPTKETFSPLKNETVSQKKKIVHSPLSLKIDEHKTLDHFYGLKESQIQLILTKLNHGGKIAFCGESGTGKSHLAHGLANAVKEKRNVVYTTGEKFCKEFWAYGKKKSESMKQQTSVIKEEIDFFESFDGIDLLIIDGIEALGGSGKANTQNALKKILIQQSEMALVLTSAQSLKEIPWMRKQKAADGTPYETPSSLLEEIRGLMPIQLSKLPKEQAKPLVEKQRKAFREKENSIFLPEELPQGIITLLGERVQPALYEQIFDTLHLNLPQPFTCETVFPLIQEFLTEKVHPRPEEIIDIIITTFLDDTESLGKYINFDQLSGKWKENAECYEKKEIRNKLNMKVSTDSVEGLMLRLCCFFIKQCYPKKNWTEIGELFGGKTQGSKMYDEAKDWLLGNKPLLNFWEKNMKDFLMKKYGIDVV